MTSFKFEAKRADNETQAEVESFGNSLQASGKVLQEKFSLVRELDRLRPELEHLQSQLSSHQTVVAEKHRLQRQLDSLEVELENEKRSRQRARDKVSKDVATEFKSRAEDAEKRLASEKRERDKMNKEYEKSLSDATSRNERLEEQVSIMTEKLKGLQKELKDTKRELGRHHTELERARAAEHSPKSPAPATKQANRKRQVDNSSLEESTVQTPGNEHQVERRPSRKRGGEHAPVGEKSNFSVTPFLNRNRSTTNGPQDSFSTELPAVPGSESAKEAEIGDQRKSPGPIEYAEGSQPAASPAKPSNLSKPKTQKPRGQPKANPLVEAPSSKRNVSKQSERPLAEPNLHSAVKDLSSEVDQENAPAPKPGKMPQNKSKPTLRPGVDLGPHVVGDANGKRKRRKLLGGANTTIFDEDDGEAVPNTTATHLGQTANRKRAPLGGASDAFAGTSFSPLKRDRRGVGASFLA